MNKNSLRAKLLEKPILRISLGAAVLLAAASLLTPYPAKLAREVRLAFSQPTEPSTAPEPSRSPSTPAVTQGPPAPNPAPPRQTSPVPTPTPPTPQQQPRPPAPRPPALPAKVDSSAVWDVQQLTRGIQLNTGIEFTPGSVASLDRNDPANFRVELKLHVALPNIVTDPQKIAQLNPELPKIFPNFNKLISSAQPSPYFNLLYNAKRDRMRTELLKLNRLTTRHNYYDCESILQFITPSTRQPVLWIQSEMDVVSDGSDGDRLDTMPDSIVDSTYYQPFTSYFWKKTSKTPNPMLAGWEKRLKTAQTELADPKTDQAKKQSLQSTINTLKLGIHDLKVKSYLVAEHDPFIVIPLGILKRAGDAFSPSPGDYCVVIHKDKLYPAIVGDAGPRHKIGEASLRLAQEINARSNPYSRPVSDLKVTYIVFPGTADANPAAPEYTSWTEKCQRLLDDLGGISPDYRLHYWDYTFPMPADTPPGDPKNIPTPPPADPQTPAATRPADNSASTRPAAPQSRNRSRQPARRTAS